MTGSNRSSISSLVRSPYLSYALTGLLVVAGAASWYGYRTYQQSNQQNAQELVFQALELFNKEAFSKTPEWESVNAVCQAGIQQGSSTAIPYLRMIQAQVALAQDKKEDALGHVAEAVKALPASSPLYYVYKTKYALMKIDAQESTQEGLAELAALASDVRNTNRDEAQFYLGLYHWVHDEIGQAKDAWKDLLAIDTSVEHASPWARRAQAKVATI